MSDVLTKETHEEDAQLGALFDAHLRAEFDTHDVNAAMATMTSNPHLTHVPVMTGGDGYEAVKSFYSRYFIGRWPADTKITHLSRTIGENRIVDEIIVSFTHDVEIVAELPGVAPTGKKVELPHVVIVGTKDGKIEYEHIYWDQASFLVQVGLLDKSKYPVTGVEQARRLLDPSMPSNELIERRKI